MSAWLARLDSAGRRLEDLLLSAILIALIGLASWQIFGRNFLGITLTTGDELLRILVLWLTLAASVAASRADRHIAISLFDRFVSGWKLNLIRFLNHAFTAVVCALLARYSLDFVLLSREFEDTLLGDVPAWWLQAPLPLGFGLMAYRHTLHAVKSLIGRMPAHDETLGAGGREA
jgi:TRAP-type C4-dicarboxylate transport system permease small subunit